MDPETLQALEGSIDKWQRIVDGTGSDDGYRNCPLCQKFRIESGVYPFLEVVCHGCPVFEETGLHMCQGSPYSRWCDAEANGDSEEMEYAAGEELEFLKSLLPAKDPTDEPRNAPSPQGLH